MKIQQTAIALILAASFGSAYAAGTYTLDPNMTASNNSPDIASTQAAVDGLDTRITALETAASGAGSTSTSNTEINNRIDALESDMKHGLAQQAALAGLFQPYTVGKFNVTAAVGGYKSTTAMAVGAGYRVNENFAAKMGVAFGGEGASYNAGVNFEW